MKTRVIRKVQVKEKRSDPDARFREMLESYVMVPPSPYVIRKRKRIIEKSRIKNK